MNPELDRAHAAARERPQDPAAHYALAQALDRAGDAARAIASLDAALSLAPAFAEAHNLKGILVAGRGDALAAIESFQRAIAARPGYARAYNNLGNSLRAIGRLADAEHAIAEAVRHQPDYQLAQHNLGAIRQAIGRSDDAVVALQASLTLNPRFRPSWVALAAAERQRGQLERSIAAYHEAIMLAPADSSAERIGLAELLAECGFDAAARQSYDAALEHDPDNLAATIGRELGLPQIYPDDNAIDIARARFAAGLNALERHFDRLHAKLDRNATLEAWRWSNFFLAYQGRDDRDLMRRYMRLLARAVERKAPELRDGSAIAREPRIERRERRVRVGFVSAFFVDGTIGQYFGRWITDLERAAFDVVVYHLAPHRDALTERIAARADTFRHPFGNEGTIDALARTIAADALDVLVYPEIGIDARCVALSAMRLAPMQCAGWGHPVTTGSDVIDGFITAEAMEPPDGETHYVESLVRLPGLGTAYPRPPTAQPDSVGSPAAATRATLRAKLRVTDDTPVFACPQSLFKILPGDDALFARVLSAAPSAVLLLFEGRHREVTSQAIRRIAATLAAHGVDFRERVRVLSRMARADFLVLLGACDAMLDTTQWSGGNTSLDALAAGLPIVAMPGQLMRARQSAAMLEICGVPELIAGSTDEYVRIAQRLADDSEWRNRLSSRISAAAARLFDDPAPLAALARFLRDAQPHAPQSALAPSAG